MLRPGTAFRRIRAINAFSDIGMANANIDEKQIRSVLELLSFPGNLTPRQLHLSSACMGANPPRTFQTCGPRPIRQATPRYQIARVTEKQPVRKDPDYFPGLGSSS